MKKYLIKYNGENVVHFKSPLQSDYTLCGNDLAGDEDLGWSEGILTDKEVNCPDCLTIVKACNNVPTQLY